jgi:hypothetical protein
VYILYFKLRQPVLHSLDMQVPPLSCSHPWKEPNKRPKNSLSGIIMDTVLRYFDIESSIEYIRGERRDSVDEDSPRRR